MRKEKKKRGANVDMRRKMILVRRIMLQIKLTLRKEQLSDTGLVMTMMYMKRRQKMSQRRKELKIIVTRWTEKKK